MCPELCPLWVFAQNLNFFPLETDSDTFSPGEGFRADWSGSDQACLFKNSQTQTPNYEYSKQKRREAHLFQDLARSQPFFSSSSRISLSRWNLKWCQVRGETQETNVTSSKNISIKRVRKKSAIQYRIRYFWTSTIVLELNLSPYTQSERTVCNHSKGFRGKAWNM